MEDRDRDKEQLLNELIKLRTKIAELEDIKNSPKSTEKQLKKSEQLYNLIFKNSSDIIGITTFGLNPVYIIFTLRLKASGTSRKNYSGNLLLILYIPMIEKNYFRY